MLTYINPRNTADDTQGEQDGDAMITRTGHLLKTIPQADGNLELCRALAYLKKNCDVTEWTPKTLAEAMEDLRQKMGAQPYSSTRKYSL